MNDLDALLSELATEVETSPEGAQVHLLQDLLANPDMLRLPAIVLPRFAYAGRLTMLAAGEKAGKSTAIGQGAAALSTGRAFLEEPTVPSGVLWVGLDEPPSDVVRRLAHHGATEGVAMFFERPTFEQIEEAVVEHFARLVVVDTLSEFADGLVENANLPEQWTPILRQFRQIAQRTGAGIVLLHHTNRTTGKYRGSGQLGAGVDVILEMTESEGGAVTLPRDWLLAELKASGRSDGAGPPAVDLTVADLAGLFRKKPSTVRAWLDAGRFPGAYKLNGKQWRTPRSAVEAFQTSERASGGKGPTPALERSTGGLGDYRKVRRSAA